MPRQAAERGSAASGILDAEMEEQPSPAMPSASKGSLGVDTAGTRHIAPPRRSARTTAASSVSDSPSVSSFGTPADTTSVSGYSTPGTCIVAIPARGDLKPLDEQSVDRLNRLPTKTMATRGKARNELYATAPKRKRSDSDSEDNSGDDGTPDAVFARKLQNEEFDKFPVVQTATPEVGRRRSLRHASSIIRTASDTPNRPPMSAPSKIRIARPTPKQDSLEDLESTLDPSRPIPRRGRGRPPKKLALTPKVEDVEISDSDDEMDVDTVSGLEPPPPAKRSGRPSIAVQSRSVVSDSDLSSEFVSLPSSDSEAGSSGSEPMARRRGRLEPATSQQHSTILDFSDSDSSDSLSDNLDTPATRGRGGRARGAASSRRRRAAQPTRRSRNRAVSPDDQDGTHRQKLERKRLLSNHPELNTMWKDLEAMPTLKAGKAAQPTTISRRLKPFQLEGLAWMIAMEKTKWKGGLLGDEMGLGKTIQSVSLIMSDFPVGQPSLVLVPPVALMQWQSEISSYTDGTLKTFVFHGTNAASKTITVKELKKFDVIMMSYNSLESMYRKQEKGFTRKNGVHKEKSLIHAINFHRVILDEAHSIKSRTTMTAKACFALKSKYRWCLSGTPLQNRIGELFSLVRFLNIEPFASYLCKMCPCSTVEWSADADSKCTQCNCAAMQHVSVFNQELLNPIQKYGNFGPGAEAFRKLRLMTERIMLRRLKKDHTDSMELPTKDVYVDRQFFSEAEKDLASSIMTNSQRQFDTYVAQGVLLNNYANIFGLIMQMRQVADHPDLILKKNAEGGQNILVCCICDEAAEDAIKSRCKHDFCRTCAKTYLISSNHPDCPRCHIPLSIDLDQPEVEQDETQVKSTSIINRIKMNEWTSSTKIELLVHELHKLRSDNASHKSIIFSQFTTMLQLIEWRLRRAGITTVMLDGSMTPAQRQASIEHFMNNVDVECFLVSLRAGGVALNLTEASRVFIVDPWWNPAAEWQSADRAHRIGQNRPCIITRLCIEDSVESRMVLIQEKKTSMIHSTVNADDKAMEALTARDLQFLFRGN